MNRRRKYILLTLITTASILLIIQTWTYQVWAPEAKAKRLLMESMWWGDTHEYSYLVLPSETVEELTAREFTALATIIQSHGTKIVGHRDELPPENTWGEGENSGYVDASENYWRINFQYPFYFGAWYGQNLGFDARSGGICKYLWVFGRWCKVGFGLEFVT